MDNPNDEEVQQWLIKSQRDLKVAWVLFKNKESLLDAVVYHCQQSAEKSLKAYLTYSGVQTCEIRTSTTLSPLHKIFAIDTVPQLREYRYSSCRTAKIYLSCSPKNL
jgi:hypothetical protein